MHFRCKSILFSYQLEGRYLVKVSEEKDLGVVVSNDLKVSKHCSQTYAKSNKLLGSYKQNHCLQI